MDYSWSATIDIPIKQGSSIDDIWVLDACDIFPVTNEQLLVIGRTHNRSALVAAAAYQALSPCATFEYNRVQLDKMVAMDNRLQGMKAQLQEVVDVLTKSGVILSASEIVGSLNHPPVPSPEIEPVCDAYIATCDRPQALERLLHSLSEDGKLEANELRLTVVDDSRLVGSLERNREIVVEAMNSSALDLNYHGPRELEGLIEKVATANSGLYNSIRFLTQGLEDRGISTYGAAWNRALLLAGNRNLITVDDDVLLLGCDIKQYRGAVRIGDCARRVTFLSEESDWRDYINQSGVGMLQEHSRFLGRSIRDALGYIGLTKIEEEVLIGQSREALRGLTGGSPIVLTTSGVIGDPGMTSSRWLLDLAGEERDVLLESEFKYCGLKRRRNMIMAQPGYAFRSDFTLMSAVTGIHNRQPLPPYFPVLRNEDFLFGKMVQFLYPDSVVLDQPIFVPHVPLVERRWSPEEITKPEKMSVLYFLGVYIDRQRECWHGKSVEDRYNALVAIISDLAATDNKTLLQIVRNEMAALATSVVRDSSRALNEYRDAPDYWRADVEKRRDANLQYLASLDQHFLVDLAFVGGLDKQVEMFRLLLKEYSKAMADWQEISSLLG